MTRAQRILEAVDHWQHAGKPIPLYRWLGWSREEWEEYQELGVFPYPRAGAL